MINPERAVVISGAVVGTATAGIFVLLCFILKSRPERNIDKEMIKTAAEFGAYGSIYGASLGAAAMTINVSLSGVIVGAGLYYAKDGYFRLFKLGKSVASDVFEYASSKVLHTSNL